MSGSSWLRIGAVLGGLAVAIGAFGAHGLKSKLDQDVKVGLKSREVADRDLATFETASRYQMYHALALVAVGLMTAAGRVGVGAEVAGWSFLVGTIVFSGSLYALVVLNQRWLGAITPLGGLAFLVGWIALAVGAGTRS